MKWKTVAVRECDNLSADFSAYLDGELAPEQVRAIDEHLRGCDTCRRTLAELSEVARSVASLPRRTAPGDTLAAVLRAVEHDSVAGSTLHRPPRRIRWFTMVSASAATIALIGLAGWYSLVVGRAGPHTAPSHNPVLEKNGVEVTLNAPRTEPDEGYRVAGRRPGGAALNAPLEPQMDSRRGGPLEEYKKETARSTSDADGPVLKEPTGGLQSVHLGVPVEAVPVNAPRSGMHVTAHDALTGAPSTDPMIVQIVVAPRTAEEYAAVLRIASATQSEDRIAFDAGGGNQTALGNTAEESGVNESRRAGERVPQLVTPERLALAQPQVFELQTTSITAFIASLSQQAPDGVDVALRFPADEIGEVQRMLVLDSVDAAVPPVAIGGTAGATAGDSTRPVNESANDTRDKQIDADDDREQAAARAVAPAELEKQVETRGDEAARKQRESNATPPPPAQPGADAADETESPPTDRRALDPQSPRDLPPPSPAATPPPAARGARSAPAGAGGRPSRRTDSGAAAKPAATESASEGRGLAAEREKSDAAPEDGSKREERAKAAQSDAFQPPPGLFGGGEPDKSAPVSAAESPATQPFVEGALGRQITSLGRTVVELGESLIRLGGVAAPVEGAARSEATLRVRLVVLPPPQDAPPARPATSAPTRPAP